MVVSKANPSANNAHRMAHMNSAVFSADDGYIFPRRQRASDGHPVEFYLQTIIQELTNVADGSTDATIEAQNAAKSVLQLIINNTIDVSSIIKEFPSLLQGEPEHQLLKTLKLVQMQSFGKGVELSYYLDVLIEHVKASQAQPGATRSPVDTLMEHLSRFATSIYEALSYKKVT